MGWLKKKIKAAVKWAVRVLKGAARVGSRLLGLGWGLAVGFADLFFGFMLPRAKKLRIQVFILTDATGIKTATDQEVQLAIDFAKDTFKKRFNVELLPYSSSWFETIDEGVPQAALDVNCNFTGLLEEYGEAGEFFANHLAGWNVTPVSGTFPVTVFFVRQIQGKTGCSMGPLTDYVTIEGGAVPSTMAHEIGHACNLWHSFGRSNLMYKHSDRGDTVHWWQKNIFRSSRHVLYW